MLPPASIGGGLPPSQGNVVPAEPPIRILLLAPPSAPGADALLDRADAASEAGHEILVLLTGRGLAWKDEPRLARLTAARGADVALCSRSARDEGVDPASIPPFVRWSSLVAFFTGMETDAVLWGLLP